MTKEEKALDSVNLFKEFFPGVGKFFPKIFLGAILNIFIGFCFILIAVLIGIKYIGIPANSHAFMQSFLAGNPDQFLNFVSKLPPADRLIVKKWEVLTLLSTSAFSYVTMFWMQSVIMLDTNPFMAYVESFKTIFRNPITSFLLFISSSIGLQVAYMLMLVGSGNALLQLITLSVFVLTLVYFTMLTFLYFEKYSENNSNSRTDSLG